MTKKHLKKILTKMNERIEKMSSAELLERIEKDKKENINLKK